MLWKLPASIKPPEFLREFVGGNSIVSEILVTRGIDTIEKAKSFLNPAFYCTASPFEIPGMQSAVEQVNQAIKAGDLITVWGDFDVDGQTATALFVSALRQLGANVNYYIPIRKFETHGINIPSLEKVISAGTQLLLTCDTGISEVEAVKFAQSQGVKVVITDHHKIPDQLPPADAIVNPNFLQTEHPLHSLAGVAVAYKFIEGLNHINQNPLDITQFLDLAALGLISDLALLIDESRYLVQEGLTKIRNNSRLGLQKLSSRADIELNNADEGLIGFQIAPRLNALGRLDDANHAVELLLTDDESKAEMIAVQIEGLNQHRKMLTTQVSQAAIQQIENDIELRHAPILVLHHPEWPGGIVGLVASTLVSRYQKPAILLTGSGEIISGSARSIPELDITEAIRSQAQWLSGFGGHAMAGGLSMSKSNFMQFRRGISQHVKDKVGSTTIEPELEVAAKLQMADLTVDFVEDINRLSPFGPGNQGLVFVSRNLSIISDKLVGKNRDHRQLLVQSEDGITQKVIWWNGAEDALPKGKFDLAYQLSLSNYRGELELTLTWVDAKSEQKIDETKIKRELIDFRLSNNPLQELDRILAMNPDVEIWSQRIQTEIDGKFCVESLKNSQSLVLWTVPASNKLMIEIIEKVKPLRIYFFSNSEVPNSLDSFIKILIGIIKYSYSHKEQNLNILSLESRIGLSQNLLGAAFKWIDAKGLFEIIFSEEGNIQINPGDSTQKNNLPLASNHLEAAWKEYDAWRWFYLNDDIEKIVE